MIKMTHSTNPLDAPQREKAGATTFAKYLYQYHWALCRILDAHKNFNDYVVFVELHEDVIFSDSMDEANANFEFNQIKNIQSSPLKHKLLIKTTKKNKNSILGKMLLSTVGKPFFDKINQYQLVASSGFDLPLKVSGKDLSIIKIGELSDECIMEIKTAIEKEIGVKDLPSTLTFVKSNLPSIEFQNVAVGRISKLVDEKFPNKKCNVQNIYRVLMDDLQRKGSVSYDFSEWVDLLKNKGVTSKQVEQVICANTESQGIERITNHLDNISNELGLTAFHQKIAFEQAIKTYYQKIYIDRSLLNLDIQHNLKKLTEQFYGIFTTQGLHKYIEVVLDALTDDMKQKLNNDKTYIKSAIIYELLEKNDEK